MGRERPLCRHSPLHGEMLWLMDLPRALLAEGWKGRSLDPGLQGPISSLSLSAYSLGSFVV